MTMTERENNPRGVLRRDNIRVVEQPALVECGHDTASSSGSITVVPLMDGNRLSGFDVRCGCGSSAIVECVYTPEASNDPQ